MNASCARWRRWRGRRGLERTSAIGGALYAGTSGFSYASWKGTFYPASLSGARMLEYYSERLNGVELNRSFYRKPPESTLLKWAAETNPAFRFCMKAHRGLTYSADAFDRVGLAAIIGVRLTPTGDRQRNLVLATHAGWPR